MAYTAPQLLSMSQEALDNLFSQQSLRRHPQWRSTGNCDHRSRHKVQLGDRVANQYLRLAGKDLRCRARNPAKPNPCLRVGCDRCGGLQGCELVRQQGMHRPRLLEDVTRCRAHSRRNSPDRPRHVSGHRVLGQEQDHSLCASISNRMTILSNPDRPIPKANTGSALLNWLSDASMSLVHLERRFDPFFRPLFDAVLRDPLTSLATA